MRKQGNRQSRSVQRSQYPEQGNSKGNKGKQETER